MPSASELGPSDGAVAVGVRVFAGTLVAVVLAGTITVPLLALPLHTDEVPLSLGIGALLGAAYAIPVGVVAAIASATGRVWVRRTRSRALAFGAMLWLALVGLVGGQLTWMLGGVPRSATAGMLAYLPGLALTLAASALIALDVHRTEDPLSAGEIAARQRAQRRAGRHRRRR